MIMNTSCRMLRHPSTPTGCIFGAELSATPDSLELQDQRGHVVIKEFVHDYVL